MLGPIRGAPTSSRVCVCAVCTGDVRQRIDRYRDTSVSCRAILRWFRCAVFVAESLTCYTCVNVSDNQMCNEWAIDTPCPAGGRDFCRSLHILDSRGNSVLVSKSCVSSAECGPASVGCIPVDTQQICISCCDLSYCNIESPTNSTNAIFSRKRRAKSKSKRKRPGRNGVEGNRFYGGGGALWLLASLFYAYHC
ncbi:uncharacterized protein LOC122711104 isoform X1 [Apis laboriosa]|uniref:uncharacterized protein LOC122711104 isoform X1 n=1 Tax=Apis laboriosa TaxID=183418 RepID=UPI001CC6A1AB|nr:uncharacterized protein LOC122711104 isoform X1 [Apis laboriosa]